MEKFVGNFFQGGAVPGAEFIFDNNKVTWAKLDTLATFSTSKTKGTRKMIMSQGMTPLGLMNGVITGSYSNLDGLTREYLTPEGGINFDILGEAIKNNCGMTTANWSAHRGRITGWKWYDNHVTLLFNMMRFALLRRITGGEDVTHAGNLNAGWSNFEGNGVTVERNKAFKDTYPAAREWEWPGGRITGNYPTFTRLNDPQPAEDGAVVDLRNLTPEEGRFVLLMTGKWVRRSRYRLDFNLGRLIDRLSYRAAADVMDIETWRAETAAAAIGNVPVLPTWKQAWAILKKYVTHNRLFGQFSAALYIICCTMYQFLPQTVEGQWWLGVGWTISVVRGRYEILLDGEAAYVSWRGVEEWVFVSSQMEKVNMMALVFSQAYHTGLAIRSVRLGLDQNPTDILRAEIEFRQPYYISAAATEATKVKAPLPPMSAVFMQPDCRFESPDDERIFSAESVSDDAAKKYQVLRKEETKRTKVPNPKFRREMVLVGSPEATPPEPEFLDVAEKIPKYFIMVPRVSFSGIPTLIMPINAFPYATPLAMAGTIEKAEAMHLRRLKAHEAWLLSQMALVCGHRIVPTNENRITGCSVFEEPANANMTWPVMRKEGHQETELHLRLRDQEQVVKKGLDQKPRRKQGGSSQGEDPGPMPISHISFPDVCGSSFSGKLSYEMKVMRKLISRNATDRSGAPV